MIEKMKAKYRIIVLLLIITIIGSVFIKYISNAADGDVTFKVEQVTSSSQINSDNLYQYIIVAEDNSGVNHALVSCGSAGGNNMMGRSNETPVTISNGQLTVSGDVNVLWNFTKSNVSVLESGDHPVISSGIEVYGNRRNLKLCDGEGATSTGGYAGIIYVQNGNGFTFTEAGNNTFKISENNSDAENNYLTFGTFDGRTYFKKAYEADATNFKIYKVEKTYNYHSSEFLSSEETAAIEDVKVTKTVSAYENYNDTAIAEVKLATQGTDYEKLCDIILILDDSTSVYDTAPDSTDKTRAQVIREDAMIFAEAILEANPDNRISVLKFGREITNEDAVDRIGFSNNLTDIEEMIGGDKDYVSYGTDYSIAFAKANQLMEAKSHPDHGKVVIFISDGLPTWYNGINYTAFANTSDSTGTATNWLDYVTNTPLQEATLMAQTATAIYTIGALEDDTQIDSSVDGYYIPAESTRAVLTNIATKEANFYDFDKIETELENILEDIAKDFNYYPKNAVVNDHLTTDVDLLTKVVKGYIPEVIYKRGNVEIEKITFNEDGTEAYTSLNPGVNIMNGKAFEGAYVSFDGDTLKWDIGDLFRYEYTLEFPVYLNNTFLA